MRESDESTMDNRERSSSKRLSCVDLPLDALGLGKLRVQVNSGGSMSWIQIDVSGRDLMVPVSKGPGTP